MSLIEYKWKFEELLRFAHYLISTKEHKELFFKGI